MADEGCPARGVAAEELEVVRLTSTLICVLHKLGGSVTVTRDEVREAVREPQEIRRMVHENQDVTYYLLPTHRHVS